MPVIKNALVIGGGIGGLTCARALRLKDIAVDLVEIQPDWSVYGVGIIQPNNALRALGEIGMTDRCLEAGGSFDGWSIHDAHGNLLVDASGANQAAPHYPSNNGITRPKLHDILIAGAEEVGTDIRLGTSATKIHDDGSGVDATFSDGTQRRYDLVVGYDGANSATRDMLFGAGYAPEFVGQGVWRYNMPRPDDMKTGRVYFGPDTKVGLVPVSPTLMYMFVVTAEPDNRFYDGPDLADEMRARVRGYTGLVDELRQLIQNPDEVVYRPISNVLVKGDWYKGRIVIAGDAAHSTTPHLAQGASMAVEDAVLLADVLDRSLSLEAALSEFMTRRYERTCFVVNSSTQIAAWELEQWRGINNPEARPGELLHEATSALMEAY